MTKLEAKAMTLEVWGYLAEHPEIKKKGDLPDYLFNKIRHLVAKCPLCEVFLECFDDCPLCVDGVDCYCDEHPFNSWAHADAERDRQAAAKEIVRLVAAWEADE